MTIQKDRMDENKAVSQLEFYVNGKLIIELNADPETTLLSYLRKKLQLTGTKLGCGEGGCGACTVMISKWKEDKIIHYAANSCLLPLVAVHGQAVTTVEAIGSTRTKLHAVQERISKFYGSQCGFCTPGMVMSMYALLRSQTFPSIDHIEEALQGNLCRCTGYRPIIEAFSTFTQNSEDGSKNGAAQACPMGEKCCRNQSAEQGNGEELDEKKANGGGFYSAYEPSQDLVFPPQLLIDSKAGKFDASCLRFVGERSEWHRPTTIEELLRLVGRHPRARLVTGNSELGVEANVLGRHVECLISTSHVPDMHRLEVDDEGVTLGAARSLTDVKQFIDHVTKQRGGEADAGSQSLRAVSDMLYWFGGKQIRNVASIGGNLMTASPVSDLNPIWISCGARAEVADASSPDRLELPVDGDFFVGYRRTRLDRSRQVVVAVRLPFAHQNDGSLSVVRAYKTSRRREDDISLVNAAMRVVFRSSSSQSDHVTTTVVESCHVTYGGVAATPLVAVNVQSNIRGRDWREGSLVDEVASWLRKDLHLGEAAPGGMCRYREAVAASFFLKFYIDVKNQLYKRGVIKEEVPRSDLLGALEPIHSRFGEMRSTQTLLEVPTDQVKTDEVGRSKKHVAADLHSTGEAIFTDDLPILKDELYACLVLSSRAHAKIIDIDVSAASKQPGFVAYFDVNHVEGSNNFGICGDDQVFADGKVTYAGQVIGVVIGDNQQHASQACQLVRVEYEDITPCIITIEDAIQHGSIEKPLKLKRGNAEEELEKCPIQLEGEIRIAGQDHFYLETQSCLVVPKEDGEMEIFCATQDPTNLQMTTAQVLGVPAHKIAARCKRIGGGFGGKETKFLSLSNPCAVAASKLGRPVRCMLNRNEDMMITGTRHPYLGRYKVGTTEDGRIVAVIWDLYSNRGVSGDLTQKVMEKSMSIVDNAYRIPHVSVYGHMCRTNTYSCTAFRAFGVPQGILCAEEVIDKLAVKFETSPNKIREINMVTAGDVSLENLTNTDGLRRCWEECLKRSGYEQRRKEVDEFNAANKHRKRGISCSVCRFNISFGWLTLNQAGALVHIYTDGSVLVAHGGTEMGQGLHTKMIQVASRELGIPTSKIHISETSTTTVPNASPTAASFSSDLNGMAVKQACEKLMRRLEPYKNSSSALKWEEMVWQAYLDRVGLSATGFYKSGNKDYEWNHDTGELKGSPNLYLTYGCSVSEIEVDCLTGEHVIMRSDIVMDVGRSINPSIDVGQIEGAFMQGYGLYCLEEPLHSPTTGQLLTRGPGNYKIPSFANCPREFNVHLLEKSFNEKTIYGSKAIGEPPLPLANSIFFALKDAIRAHRKQNGLSPDFELHSPATVERVRLAFADQLTLQHCTGEKERGISNGHDVKPWSVVA